MLPLQTLAVRAGELRARLGELGGMAELSEENQKELDSLRSEYMDNERKQGALTIAGDEIPAPIETRDDAQGRDVRRLLTRANLGTMLQAILEGRSQDGPELELQNFYQLKNNQVPITLLRAWERFDEERRELETRAATPAPTNVGRQLQDQLDYVFPMSMTAFLGIPQPDRSLRRVYIPCPNYGSRYRIPRRGGHRH